MLWFLKKLVEGVMVIVALGTVSLVVAHIAQDKSFSEWAASRLPAELSRRAGLMVGQFPMLQGEKCGAPLEYSLGSFAPEFGITQDEFKSALNQAESVWEKPAGKNLFEYAENGTVPVNLVFDERQEQARELKALLNKIETDEDKYAAVKSQYEKQTTLLSRKREAYESQVDAYEKKQRAREKDMDVYQERLDEYNKDVSRSNASGGASSEEHEHFEREQEALEKMALDLDKQYKELKKLQDSLEEDRKALNKLVEEVNTLAGLLNTLAQKVNAKVEAYNGIERSRDEAQAGVYISDVEGTRINIYQFLDERDLALVLAHELGHALGIEHAVNDSQSVMYPTLGQQQLKLTVEDMALLTNTCSR